MTTVTILYPNGEREEKVILAGIPNVGDDIRLKSMSAKEQSLVVEHRTFPEECDAIISVRGRPNGK